MNDITDRLVLIVEAEDIDHEYCDIAADAAEEIRELRRVIYRLRDAEQAAYERGYQHGQVSGA